MTRLSCHRFRSNEVTAVAEPDRLQPGKPVAAAASDRQLVADQLEAAASEDGRAAAQTLPVLLAAVGGEPSDTAAVQNDGA